MSLLPASAKPCGFAPAVTIHCLAHARMVLAAGRPVTLLSAPSAALYAGVGWWRALIEAACPADGTADILDCGDAPGRALEALRAGQALLILRAPPSIAANIAERAARVQATLLGSRPAAFDLAGPRGGEGHALRAWLER
jgi:hypothetical protein